MNRQQQEQFLRDLGVLGDAEPTVPTEEPAPDPAEEHNVLLNELLQGEHPDDDGPEDSD